MTEDSVPRAETSFLSDNVLHYVCVCVCVFGNALLTGYPLNNACAAPLCVDDRRFEVTLEFAQKIPFREAHLLRMLLGDGCCLMKLCSFSYDNCTC